MKIVYRKVAYWIVLFSIPVFLVYTGLHKDIIVGAQKVLLWTSLFDPDVESSGKNRPSNKERNVLNDYDFPLVNLTGEELSFQHFKGKVVFINFWATWCPPCLAEMPNIQELYTKVKSSEIVFVLISVDQNTKVVAPFIQKKGFTFPVYTLKDKLPQKLESESVPVTFVIAPDGEIVFSKTGMSNYNSDFFLAFLESLAKIEH